MGNRFKAWLVTGAPARGLAFLIDFSIALGYAVVAGARTLTRR
jgi:hypothetical protein